MEIVLKLQMKYLNVWNIYLKIHVKNVQLIMLYLMMVLNVYLNKCLIKIVFNKKLFMI